MHKRTWLWSLIVVLPFCMVDSSALGCGPHESNAEEEQANHLAARMLSITAGQNLTHEQLKELDQVTNQLRTLGPTGLVAATNSWEIGNQRGAGPSQLELIDKRLDIIAGQKQARNCQLFWYKSLATALARSTELKRPVLSLRLLGKLDEDLSCANSRFFREVLYTKPQIADLLRHQFILHWQAVRDVPIATIDFGNGKKLRQPIIGNSVHLVLSGNGQVIDALPGLVTPAEFIRWMQSVSELHHEISIIPQEARKQQVQHWHRDRAQRRRQRCKLTILPSQMVKDLNPLDPRWKDAAEELRLTADIPTLARLPKEPSNATAAMRIAPLKMAAELPLFRMVDAVEPRVEQDSFFNLYGLQPKLDDWYTHDAQTGDYEDLTQRIYKELFLMPLNDPWLGLSHEDRFIALENRGRRTTKVISISATEVLKTPAN